jgi:hypothetical protein
MFLIPPEVRKKHRLYPTKTTGLKILNIKNHSFDKETHDRLHQETYLRAEKSEWEPVPAPRV